MIENVIYNYTASSAKTVLVKVDQLFNFDTLP